MSTEQPRASSVAMHMATNTNAACMHSIYTGTSVRCAVPLRGRACINARDVQHGMPLYGSSLPALKFELEHPRVTGDHEIVMHTY